MHVLPSLQTLQTIGENQSFIFKKRNPGTIDYPTNTYYQLQCFPTTNIPFDVSKKEEMQRLQECLCPLLS